MLEHELNHDITEHDHDTELSVILILCAKVAKMFSGKVMAIVYHN